jgi:hypothetical protein
MKTTLNEVRKHEPCQDFWEKLLRYLNKTEPDDEPLPLLTVLESSGLEETLWCFRAVEGLDKEKRLLAIAFARLVENLICEAVVRGFDSGWAEECRNALEVSEKFANGLATKDELDNARKEVDAADLDDDFAEESMIDAANAARASLAADAAQAAHFSAAYARQAITCYTYSATYEATYKSWAAHAARAAEDAANAAEDAARSACHACDADAAAYAARASAAATYCDDWAARAARAAARAADDSRSEMQSKQTQILRKFLEEQETP